jgi:hypothetical protein
MFPARSNANPPNDKCKNSAQSACQDGVGRSLSAAKDKPSNEHPRRDSGGRCLCCSSGHEPCSGSRQRQRQSQKFPERNCCRGSSVDDDRNGGGAINDRPLDHRRVPGKISRTRLARYCDVAEQERPMATRGGAGGIRSSEQDRPNRWTPFDTLRRALIPESLGRLAGERRALYSAYPPSGYSGLPCERLRRPRDGRRPMIGRTYLEAGSPVRVLVRWRRTSAGPDAPIGKLDGSSWGRRRTTS